VRRSVAFAVLAVTLVVEAMAQVASPASAGSRSGTPTMLPLHVVRMPDGPFRHRPLSPAGLVQRAHGYLPGPGGPYRKAATRSTASSPAARTARAAPLTPVIHNGFAGDFQTGVSPPDTSGAAGPNRYIELVDRRFAIYHRSGSLVAEGLLKNLIGATSSNISSPQIHWDPVTGVFYYVALDSSAGAEVLNFGWSKTATPTDGSIANWCKWGLPDYGPDGELPDFPRLGDTKDFGLIGVNVYNDSNLNYLRSDLVWFTKPTAATAGSCATPAAGRAEGLTDGTGIDAFTPVPAVQTDPSSQGYVVSAPFSDSPTDSQGNEIVVIPVTNVGSIPAVGAAKRIALSPHWTSPTNAPQKGTIYKLDTLDGRLTQAVSGVDPARTGQVTAAPGAVWTQHAVLGGPGSKVEWFEIDPSGGSVIQTGDVVDTSNRRWFFNGAIAPDRQVTVSAGRFGDAMVVGYNSSGPGFYPAIKAISKIGNAPASGGVTLKQSAGYNRDDTCNPRPCDWGFYSNAAPDPVSSGGAHGWVWLANEWNVPNQQGTDWRTFIGQIAP
jgi:hypothetical protein